MAEEKTLLLTQEAYDKVPVFRSRRQQPKLLPCFSICNKTILFILPNEINSVGFVRAKGGEIQR